MKSARLPVRFIITALVALPAASRAQVLSYDEIQSVIDVDFSIECTQIQTASNTVLGITTTTNPVDADNFQTVGEVNINFVDPDNDSILTPEITLKTNVEAQVCDPTDPLSQILVAAANGVQGVCTGTPTVWEAFQLIFAGAVTSGGAIVDHLDTCAWIGDTTNGLDVPVLNITGQNCDIVETGALSTNDPLPLDGAGDGACGLNTESGPVTFFKASIDVATQGNVFNASYALLFYDAALTAAWTGEKLRFIVREITSSDDPAPIL